jgi:hypothetical protein
MFVPDQQDSLHVALWKKEGISREVERPFREYNLSFAPNASVIRTLS